MKLSEDDQKKGFIKTETPRPPLSLTPEQIKFMTRSTELLLKRQQEIAKLIPLIKLPEIDPEVLNKLIQSTKKLKLNNPTIIVPLKKEEVKEKPEKQELTMSTDAFLVKKEEIDEKTTEFETKVFEKLNAIHDRLSPKQTITIALAVGIGASFIASALFHLWMNYQPNIDT